MTVRVLLLADTHLGFDQPTSPRVRRRRRGADFLANYERALAPAHEGAVDLVVHGGDVFHHPRVPHTLVYQAFEPLKRIADSGIPVFVVPGNHERSRIPSRRFAVHPGVNIFDAPRTVLVGKSGLRIAVSGFPYQRSGVRARFAELVKASGHGSLEADVALLCVHHCFEGATVGPADYTFRSAPDVVRAADVPNSVAAVLTGHVHRRQVLTTDLSGRRLRAPVLYPGSVERTAFAEMGEPKGYMLLDVEPHRGGGRLTGWTFEELPARPMVERELNAEGLDQASLEHSLRQLVRSVPADAVLRVKLSGRVRESARPVLAASSVRGWAPETVNLQIALPDEPRRRGPVRRTRSGPPEPTRPLQHALPLHPCGAE